MDVIIADNTPTNEHVEHMREVLSTCLEYNNVCLNVEDIPWEFVALILPGEAPEQLMVTFALRSTADNKIRLVIGATRDGRSLSIEETIAQSNDGLLDAVMFLDVAVRASTMLTELKAHPNPNTVH